MTASGTCISSIAAEAILGCHLNPRMIGPDRPGGIPSRMPLIRGLPATSCCKHCRARIPSYSLHILYLWHSRRAQSFSRQGQEVDEIYFPLSGMVSLVVLMQDGRAIETATVGREGVVGAMAGLGLHVSRVRAIAQLPMFASRISTPQLRKAVEASKTNC